MFETYCEGGQVRASIEGFERWMLHHRGVTPSTIEVYRRVLILFIQAQGEDPGLDGAKGIRQFVLARAGEYGPDYAKTVTVAVRMFLRYLSAHSFFLCVPREGRD